MISAHWEAPVFTVQITEKPVMIYNYSGFPEYTYQIRYSCPGSPDLAKRVQQLVNAANITVTADDQRGYDHGMYSPMKVIYPKADIPVVQLSLKRRLEPLQYIELGAALSPLHNENTLILASAITYILLVHKLPFHQNNLTTGSIKSSFNKILNNVYSTFVIGSTLPPLVLLIPGKDIYFP